MQFTGIEKLCVWLTITLVAANITILIAVSLLNVSWVSTDGGQ